MITISVGCQFINLVLVNSLHGRHSNVLHLHLYNVFSICLWSLCIHEASPVKYELQTMQHCTTYTNCRDDEERFRFLVNNMYV
jgi:hypothetical protein